MKVFIERTKEIKELSASSISDLLKQLELSIEEVLITRNGKLITQDTSISEDDELKILSVISGG